MPRRKFLVYGGAGALALGGALFAGWWQVDGPGAPGLTRQRPLPLSSMSFALIDHEGNKVGPGMLIGQATMVFFGFSNCPDICPTTLSDISKWLDALGDDSDKINVVFITVDPDRDNAEAMAEYVRYFHPAIRGWTGSRKETEKVADEFGITFEKMNFDNGGYSMNHTASVFLFDKKGRFTGVIDYHESKEFAVPKIQRAMRD
ncbi:SCO family protein [Maritalea porphyrae]|uniref:SCO family protein n=1 Tax=Maritalea porphyrae TaxID=880732 RepID=UPI0022AFF8C1|nr:SCO family protein [Maritalea porphyrae]MCZ4273351.1 SCO family protein [Maritalea porphyrae]